MITRASRDPEGFLFDPDDWNGDIAIVLADEEGIELNETYWPILDFIRKYYREHSIAPDVRHLINYLASDNQWEKKRLRNLFLNCFHTVT